MSNEENKCQDCGCSINEGEANTFGVCDKCWDVHYRKVHGMPVEKETQEERFTRNDMAKMFIGGLLNQESFTIDEFGKHLETAQSKIDGMINLILETRKP